MHSGISRTPLYSAAYAITNDDTRTYSSISVSDLEKMIGVCLLPGLSRKVRDRGMELPQPASRHGGKKRRSPAANEFTLGNFSRSLIDAINCASQH
ncbi:MAG: hypothetical protein ABI606_05035 [Rhodoferax sp.]